MAEANEKFFLMFVVDGKPQAKQRPRLGKHGHVYTPKETINYERVCAWSATIAMKKAGVRMTEQPLVMTVTINMPIAASWPKQKKADALENKIPAMAGGDLDNIVKSIKDGLNEIAYVDDKQVIELHVIKRYAQEPSAVVSLCSWPS